MTNKKRILFIINPISGVGKKNTIPSLIEKHLNTSLFDYIVTYTKYQKHGYEIAAKEKANYDIIVAVGGDGSVNEIGSALIESDCALAIIPSGSGNGLARHAKIPLKYKQAIDRINKQKSQKIDTGTVNGHVFLGTCGFGFDALIAEKFNAFHKRGFFTYIRLVITEFRKYSAVNFKITTSTESFERKALLCSVANSSQFGNGFTISPFSDLQDGKFELIFLRKLKFISLPFVTPRFFTKTIHRSRHFSSINFNDSIVIENVTGEKNYCHIDGEPIERDSRFVVQIKPSSLWLI